MFVVRALALAAVVGLAACVSLVAPYDPQFDQDLNKLSQDTAKFLAAAASGGPERLTSSKEAVAYFAAGYNTLDRLSQRAALKRGRSCIGNEALKAFADQPTSRSKLPEDYVKFDCLEAQLYFVRFYLDQLAFAEDTGGALNKGEVDATGTPLQTAILGAIQTFLVSKPA